MLVGVDVVAVDRIAAVVARRPRFLERVYTDGEVADCLRDGVEVGSAVAATRLAGRFAAKEAAKKALGTGLTWREVEVRQRDDGAPELWVRGAPANAAVSFAHDGGFAVAFVVAQGL